MTLWVLLSAAAAVWISINAVVIVLQRRSAASTIAWLTVLVFLPILGGIIYTLIGPLRLERRRRRRELAKRIVDEGLRGLAALDAEPDLHQLAMISVGLGGAPPLRAESLEIYYDGVSTYAALLAAVAAARDHIHLEYYIWEPDTIGTRLRDALVERARAGVKVRCSSTAPAARTCRASSCVRCATPAPRSRGSTRCGCARSAAGAPTSAATARS